MRIPLIIAAASITEHRRRKLILVFSIISLLATGLLIYLTRQASAEAVFGPEASIGQFITLGFLQFFALIAALAVSMGNVGQPFASGEAQSVLVRPVTRWQFVLGRYLGSVTVIAGLCLLMALESQLVQFIAVQELSADLWWTWAVATFNLSVVAAMTTFASVFFSVPAVAAILGFVGNQIVGASRFVHAIEQTGEVSGTLATIFKVIWYATPKYLTSPFDQIQGQREGVIDMIVDNTPGLAIWAAAWLVGLVVLSALLSRRKRL